MKGRTCYLDGWLVNAKTRLPTDPSEYLPKQADIFGCNRLKCRSCGSWVRSSSPGWGLPGGTELKPEQVKSLYETENWDTLPHVKHTLSSRLYVCLCSYFECVIDSPLGGEKDSPNDPYVPWECAGHPTQALPKLVLGELTIDEDTSWPELVGKVLGGVVPRPLGLGPLEEGPSLWLGWLYDYLKGGPFPARFSTAIGERIDDPDPIAKGTALRFFTKFPQADGIAQVIAAAEAAPDQVAVGYPVPEHWIAPTLWDVVIARLENRGKQPDSLDGRAFDILRKVMLIPLSSLSHRDVGELDLADIERKRRVAGGKDVDSPAAKERLEKYAAMLGRQRVDVVTNDLERYSVAFKDAKLREWITDHIVAIDRANPGRWRPLMNLLTDYFDKPDTGHLIVIAGMDVLQSRVASVAEFREWMDWRRQNHGWMDPAWVEPLKDVLTEQEKKAPPN